MTVIPLNRIEAKRRELNLLVALAAIPMLVGWLAAKIWVSVTWFIAALAVGWESGIGKKPSDSG